jgi:hypothetical protein
MLAKRGQQASRSVLMAAVPTHLQKRDHIVASVDLRKHLLAGHHPAAAAAAVAEPATQRELSRYQCA